MSGKDSIILPSARIFREDTNGDNNPLERQQKPRSRRSKPGNPDPRARVIALSPKDLLTKVDYVCEICHKVLQTKQKLRIHQRCHSIPWNFRRSGPNDPKPVYVCPVPSCVHHNPLRALRGITGIKKHFSRKHCERKWKCHLCLKSFAIEADLKAHNKNCGNYQCACGFIFSWSKRYEIHRRLHEFANEWDGLRSPSSFFGESRSSASAEVVDNNNMNIIIPHQNEPPSLDQASLEVATAPVIGHHQQQNPSRNGPLYCTASTIMDHGRDPLPVESFAPLYSTIQTQQAGRASGTSPASATPLQRHKEEGMGATLSKLSSWSSSSGGLLGSMIHGQQQHEFQVVSAQETPSRSPSSTSFFNQVINAMNNSYGNELQFFGQVPVARGSFSPFSFPSMEADNVVAFSVGLPAPTARRGGQMMAPLASSSGMPLNNAGGGPMAVPFISAPQTHPVAATPTVPSSRQRWLDELERLLMED